MSIYVPIKYNYVRGDTMYLNKISLIPFVPHWTTEWETVFQKPIIKDGVITNLTDDHSLVGGWVIVKDDIKYIALKLRQINHLPDNATVIVIDIAINPPQSRYLQSISVDALPDRHQDYFSERFSTSFHMIGTPMSELFMSKGTTPITLVDPVNEALEIALGELAQYRYSDGTVINIKCVPDELGLERTKCECIFDTDGRGCIGVKCDAVARTDGESVRYIKVP